ncbi:MAG: FAD-binding oxidoreductase [Chloroflexota bacterium]
MSPCRTVYPAPAARADPPALRRELERIVGPERVSTVEVERFAVARDFWPVTCNWFLDGTFPAVPDLVVWPESTAEVSAIMQLANRLQVPVTPFGEGSGVLGGAVAVRGGISLDMKRMNRVLALDERSLHVTVQAGLNGELYERWLAAAGYTGGHIPQSVRCSTVGGWISCRAAGQFSTKYGKIEDIVAGLEVVLPTGEIVRSKAMPRASTGPRWEQLLLGGEGTLGVITEATLRIWPKPEARAMLSFAFDGVEPALEAVRLILRRGYRPAVVRIYDELETGRNFPDVRAADGKVMLVLLCEGDRRLVELEAAVCNEESLARGGAACGERPVEHWLRTRFDVSLSSHMIRKGAVIDTLEVAAPWAGIAAVHREMTAAMMAVEGTLVASGHFSHVYADGACLYVTLCGFPPNDLDSYYRAVWDAAMDAVLRNGGTISHHHGVGLQRARFMAGEHGAALEVLRRVKRSLDPNGVMNPGKLGLEVD